VTESTDKPDVETEATPPSAPASQANETQQRPQPIPVDDSKAIASYANFCRVTGSPEEMIIDFGLNDQPMGVPGEPLVISQRIIVNFYTAKLLLGALSMAVQRHEATFGVLETNIQKRVQGGAARPSEPAT
jgi:hypothetical protein